MKNYDVFEDLEDNSGIWVIINNSDLCNVIAQPVDSEGQWILCLDPNCSDNDISKIKFLSGETVKLVKDCMLPSDTACPKAYSSIKCVECPHLK